MEREQVLTRVKKRVESLPGVIAMEMLTPELRTAIIGLETEAEKNGACGGLMPFTNRGVWESFRRQEQFVIVLDNSSLVLGDDHDLVYISDQSGQRVGEWLNEERMKEMKGREDVCYVSPDFILYADIKPVGEPFFVLPEMEFPYLKEIEEVENVTSGSISTLADDYIRNQLGYANGKHWTHLIGFDIRKT
ncbi:MAG: hypothetical protein LUO85_05990 [Methanomassiliicoccales archaeon]|nr:hypothetical protein [Methanomassiliicoccales archaeon]